MAGVACDRKACTHNCRVPLEAGIVRLCHAEHISLSARGTCQTFTTELPAEVRRALERANPKQLTILDVLIAKEKREEQDDEVGT